MLGLRASQLFLPTLVFARLEEAGAKWLCTRGRSLGASRTGGKDWRLCFEHAFRPDVPVGIRGRVGLKLAEKNWLWLSDFGLSAAGLRCGPFSLLVKHTARNSLRWVAGSTTNRYRV